MLKLLKYEFRKGLTGLLVLLGVTAALEAYFLYGLYSWADDGLHVIISIPLLCIMTLAVYIYVLVRGVTSYSGELKSRSSYLIFMTPHSTRKIIASKFLYTLVLSTLMAAVYIGLGALDIRLLLGKLGEWQEFIEEFSQAMRDLGVNMQQIAFAGVFTALYMVLSMLCFFAEAFLAVTLSHTLFRDQKFRWLVAVVFFLIINYAVSALGTAFPAVYTSMEFIEAPGVGNIAAAYGISTTPTFGELMLLLVPQMVISAAVVVLSFFGCAWMLDKKVSL